MKCYFLHQSSIFLSFFSIISFSIQFKDSFFEMISMKTILGICFGEKKRNHFFFSFVFFLKKKKKMAFKVPHLIFWVLILGGLGLNFAYAYLWQIPFKLNILFFVSDETLKLIAQIVFPLAVLIHIAEGYYAYTVAKSIKNENEILWGLQTFILGYPSLKLLLEQRKSGKQN